MKTHNINQNTQLHIPAYASAEYIIAPGAKLTLDISCEQSHKDPITYRFRVQKEAKLHATFLCAAVDNLGINIELYIDEKAEVDLRGWYVLKKQQSYKVMVHQQHCAPHATSNVVFKGMLSDAARLHFSGTIIVDKEAQHTDAALYNKNLLLSNSARVVSLPQLEVNAHQVRCKHGSAMGRFDSNQLFYLYCRGFTPQAAQAILLRGFFADMPEKYHTFLHNNL